MSCENHKNYLKFVVRIYISPTAMKRLFLITIFALAFSVSAMAQDKIYGYTYQCSKYYDELKNILTDSHICPESEGDEHYFVYHELLNCFVPTTKDGKPILQHYLPYVEVQECYVGVNPTYAPHGEFISLNFGVYMIIRIDEPQKKVYDIYFLTSIVDIGKK